MKQLNLYYINSGSSVPEGRTVLPTDDVSIWQRCGETGTTYTSLGQILADVATLIALMSSENACDYLVRSTTWTSAITTSIEAMKAIGASDYCSTTLISDNTWNTAIQNSTYKSYVDNVSVPVMTDNTHPYGEAKSTNNTSDAWKAFDGDTSTAPNAGSSVGGHFNQYDFGRAVNIFCCEYYYSYASVTSITCALETSDNGNDFTILESGISASNNSWGKIVGNYGSHRYWRVAESVDPAKGGSATEIQFYGRENGGVQTWLRSAGITDKTYTTLAEVLADSTTLSALMADHNAVDYLVTAKAWASTICADSTAMSYIGLNNYCADTLLADETWCKAIKKSAYRSNVLNISAPTMTSDTAPSGIVTYSNYYQEKGWKAFSNVSSNYWQSSVNTNDRWIQYEFDSPVKIYSFEGVSGYAQSGFVSHNITVSASNDGVSYTTLKTVPVTSYTDATTINADGSFAPSIAYKYYKLEYDNYCYSAGGQSVSLLRGTGHIFYGREDV